MCNTRGIHVYENISEFNGGPKSVYVQLRILSQILSQVLINIQNAKKQMAQKINSFTLFVL